MKKLSLYAVFHKLTKSSVFSSTKLKSWIKGERNSKRIYAKFSCHRFFLVQTKIGGQWNSMGYRIVIMVYSWTEWKNHLSLYRQSPLNRNEGVAAAAAAVRGRITARMERKKHAIFQKFLASTLLWLQVSLITSMYIYLS